jgi:hypothetical protein
MDLRYVMEERTIHRWVRLVLFGGMGVFGISWALVHREVKLLAYGVGLLMIGIAFYCRPLGHFYSGSTVESLARLASSPLILFLWIGGWAVFAFGVLVGLVL